MLVGLASLRPLAIENGPPAVRVSGDFFHALERLEADRANPCRFLIPARVIGTVATQPVFLSAAVTIPEDLIEPLRTYGDGWSFPIDLTALRPEGSGPLHFPAQVLQHRRSSTLFLRHEATPLTSYAEAMSVLAVPSTTDSPISL
jgi:hypothetical protein